MDNLVFTLDLVGRLGEQLARRLLAQNVSLFIGGSDLVRRIRLAEAEL